MSPYFKEALAIFGGSAPLLIAIVWANLQQNARFEAMRETNKAEHDSTRTLVNTLKEGLKRIEEAMNAYGSDIKALGIRSNEHETRITVLERQGPRVVTR